MESDIFFILAEIVNQILSGRSLFLHFSSSISRVTPKLGVFDFIAQIA